MFFESLGNLLGLPSWKLYHQQTLQPTLDTSGELPIGSLLSPGPRWGPFLVASHTHMPMLLNMFTYNDQWQTRYFILEKRKRNRTQSLHFCLKISRRHFEVNVQLILIKINKLLGLWKWFTTWRRNGYPIHQEKDLLTSYSEETPPASSSWHTHLGHE